MVTRSVRLTEIDTLERARRFLVGRDVTRIETLVGDASNRAYCRLVLGTGERRILALLPEAFEPETLPFLEVASLFAAIPVRIPEVIEVAGEQGILLLEDLGDDLLQDVVERESSERKRALYQEAVELLAQLQLRGAELESEHYRPFRISFDQDKFSWELEFFREHFLEGYRGCVLEGEEREALESTFGSLSAELCTQEFVLCHRDYHSRNLMVVPEGIAVIDFQDARRGPRAYDVVSLLNDSYVAHTTDFVASMVDRFENAVGSDVSRDYDVAALQRNLKALGTFGYQIESRNNDVYERYVSGTLELVRANLARNARWDSLRRILARHCEELR